ncbi:MAG: hypothetical protein HDQ88_06990 [Clostridia bacterium]|nr:hypothetical protein [Clostridia bacterium]
MKISAERRQILREFPEYITPATVRALLDDIDWLLERAADFRSRWEREANTSFDLENMCWWLADRCREFCESQSYCGECPMFDSAVKRASEDCGESVTVRSEKHCLSATDWIHNAREAVVGDSHDK